MRYAVNTPPDWTDLGKTPPGKILIPIQEPCFLTPKATAGTWPMIEGFGANDNRWKIQFKEKGSELWAAAGVQFPRVPTNQNLSDAKILTNDDVVKPADYARQVAEYENQRNLGQKVLSIVYGDKLARRSSHSRRLKSI